jgi:hypothetical protein
LHVHREVFKQIDRFLTERLWPFTGVKLISPLFVCAEWPVIGAQPRQSVPAIVKSATIESLVFALSVSLAALISIVKSNFTGE